MVRPPSLSSRVAVLALALLAAAAGLGASAEEAVPGDAPGFVNYVQMEFARAMPGAAVSVTGPLTLRIRPRSGSEHVAYLDTLFAFCRRSPERCAPAVATHVRQLAATYDAPAAAPDRSKLRAVLRPAPYIEQLRRSLAGKGQPVAVPFLAGLWIVCMVDLPEAMQTVSPADLAALGLDRDQAITIGKANVAGVLRPLRSVLQDIPRGAVGTIRGDPYESSRLLFPEAWREAFAGKAGLPLVAAPGTDMVIWTVPKDEAGAADLAAAGRLAQGAGLVFRPLSTAVFRLTSGGWEMTGL